MLRQGRQTAQEGDCLRSAIHVGIVPDAAQEVGCDLFPIDDKGPQPLWRYQRDGEVNRFGVRHAGRRTGQELNEFRSAAIGAKQVPVPIDDKSRIWQN